MSESTKRTGKTLGQVAWEQYRSVYNMDHIDFASLNQSGRSHWEEIAVAVVQAFLSDEAQAVDTKPSLGCTDP